MAVIPPWISVSPQAFLQAAQAGAETGLQVANLRQRGALEQARLAQAAAEAAANRSSAETRAGQALDFQRWEREMMDRARAEALAQQGQQAAATLAERGREADLASATNIARAEAAKAHYQQMEKRDSDRIKAQLGLPTRLHIGRVGNNVVGTDPFTGKTSVLYTAPEDEDVKISGIPVNREYPEMFGTASGSMRNPYIRERMGTNAPAALGLGERPKISDPLGILSK